MKGVQFDNVDQVFLNEKQKDKFICPLQRTDERYIIYKQLVYQYSPILKSSFPTLSKSAIRKQIFQMFCDLPDFLYESIWNDYASHFRHSHSNDASCYSDSEYEYYIEEEDSKEMKKINNKIFAKNDC